MIKPSSCDPCKLVNISQGFIESEGTGSSGVVLLGDCGGFNEYLDGLPFRPHGQGGSKLEEVFRQVQKETGQPCNRNQFLMYNMVNCHPPGEMLYGAIKDDAVSCCNGNVDRVIGGFKTPLQKTILAMGDIPLSGLVGVSGIADKKEDVSYLRGFVFKSKYGLVIPTYHPKFIRLGNGHLTPLLVEDLKRALNVAKGVWTNHQFYKEYKPPIYQVAPSIDEAWSFYYKVKDNERLILTYDIETGETGNIDEDERDDLENVDIVLVQFSLAIGTGIAMPWNSDYLPIIIALFGLSNVKGNHNTWNFDNPRLRAKGIELKGKIHDTMWMFKHYHPKLPRGLQSVASFLGFPFPWKHLYGTNLNWYGCADVDAVQFILSVLPKLMKDKGVWEGYVNHVYHIHTILDRGSRIGLPINEDKRIGLEERFKKERLVLHKEIQKDIPEEIRNIRPRRKDKETGEIDYGYVREPRTVGTALIEYNRLAKLYLEQNKSIITFDEYLWKKYNLTSAIFKKIDSDTGQQTFFDRWCIVDEFKASNEQLKKYLRYKQQEIQDKINILIEDRQVLYNGRNPELTQQIRDLEELLEDYKVPITTKRDKHTGKTSTKESTNKQELEEIYINTGDKVLEKVIKIRSYDTNISNYIPNWKPSKDGSVHTTWGFTAPTGQFDARRPNILNCSKHTEFGNEFRGIIEAPTGRVFVEFDKKSFHVATLGYCANDRDYIRFSQIDPHSILGSYIDPNVIGTSISLKWSDADIKIAAEEFKKRCKEHKAVDPLHNIDVRQALAKPTVLGNQLEVGPKRLQSQNRRFIEYAYERQRIAHKGKGYSAEGLQQIIKDLFPKPDKYKEYIKEKAYQEKFLVNEFQRIQYFYDVFVFSYNKKTLKWNKKESTGAREPIAFRVQGCAFGMLDDELLEMEKQGICEEHRWVNSIHDSVIFLPEKGKLDRCIEDVYKIMSSPCGKLVNEATGPQGLIVMPDVSVGINWKGYHKDKNLDGMKEIKI